MPLTIKDGTIHFSSGRTENANCGIIGLSEDFTAVYNGYDGLLDYHPGRFNDPDELFRCALSPNDMRELADYMIDLWTRFKEQLPNE